MFAAKKNARPIHIGILPLLALAYGCGDGSNPHDAYGDLDSAAPPHSVWPQDASPRSEAAPPFGDAHMPYDAGSFHDVAPGADAASPSVDARAGGDAAPPPREDGAAAPTTCNAIGYESTPYLLLGGSLELTFEDISRSEGMQHVRLRNLSSAPIYFGLDVTSKSGRVGVMCPQGPEAHLDPGETLVGYILYYSTGQAGPATYDLTVTAKARDLLTGSETGVSDSLSRNVSFVRGSETPVRMSTVDASLGFQRTKQIRTDVGFWRYAVDAAEKKIVLFPGQENWSTPAAIANSTLYAYDLDGNELFRHATLGRDTWGGDMTADGKYIAYATTTAPGAGAGKLVLLDGTTGTVVQKIDLSVASLPTPAHAIPPVTREVDSREVRFSPDGTSLAVGTSAGRTYLMDRDTLAAKWAVQTEGQVRGIAFQGEYLYIGAGDGLLHKVKQSDGATVWKAYTTAWPYSEPAFSPDGKMVVVGAKSGGFTVLDTATGGCMAQANHGTVRRAFFTPDGAYVVAATGAINAGTVAYRTSDWSVAWRAPMSAAASVTADSRYVMMADGKGWIVDASAGVIAAELDPGFGTGANYFKVAYLSKSAARAVIARRDTAPGEINLAFFARP